MSSAILVTRVGAATGSRAAAAALACAGSEPGRAGLLIDLSDARPPRPSLVASTAARELEERLAAHLPDAGVASRGQTCQLTLPADPGGLDRVAGALAIVRDSIGVVHLPPRLFRPALADARVRPSGALLRADLGEDRALAALAARDLMGRGIRVAVLKRPLGWIAARRALAGILPRGAGAGLRQPACRRLLEPISTPSSIRTLRLASELPGDRALIDTSVAVRLGEFDPAQIPGEIAVSTLTLAELAAGPHAASDDLIRARRQQHLQHIEAKIEPLPFDPACARAYGRVYAAAEGAGRGARGAHAVDLMIAATALAHELALYTLNRKDLRGLEELIEIVDLGD